jgi:hypothetical protein
MAKIRSEPLERPPLKPRIEGFGFHSAYKNIDRWGRLGVRPVRLEYRVDGLCPWYWSNTYTVSVQKGDKTVSD